jgi:predicted unusual protein kinase regulating ubiquinone biosynthesis (AarF/ABC1/UbiB family)
MRVLHCLLPMRSVRRFGEVAGYVWRTSRTLRAIRRGGEHSAHHAHALVEDTARAGVLFIKMAQFVSSRPDLVQDLGAREALEALQRAVPTEAEAPPDLAGVVVEDTPFATASIASVYKGRRGSVPVVVKRVRSGVRERVAEDLPLLILVLQVARWMNVAGAANMLEIVQECVPMVTRELDLRHEAQSQQAVRHALRGLPWLHIPEVYEAEEEYMVSEYVPSRKFTDAVPTVLLAKRLFEVYLRMVAESGNVHADPHAGNIGVQVDGTLVLYDFGATVDVTDARASLATMFTALARQDVDAGIRALVGLGVIKADPSTAARVQRLVPKLRQLLQSSDINAKLGQLPEFSANADRIFELTTRYVYLARSLAIVQGLITYHDPSFRLSSYLEDHDDILAELSDVPVWSMVQDMAADAMATPGSLRTMQASVSDLSLLVMQELPSLKVGLGWVVVALGVNMALLSSALMLVVR